MFRFLFVSYPSDKLNVAFIENILYDVCRRYYTIRTGFHTKVCVVCQTRKNVDDDSLWGSFLFLRFLGCGF